MSDLFTPSEAFPHLSFYLSEKILGNKEEFSLLPEINWSRENISKMEWKKGDVFLIHHEDLKNALFLSKKNPFCFFCFHGDLKNKNDYLFNLNEMSEGELLDLFKLLNKKVEDVRISEWRDSALLKIEAFFKKGASLQKELKMGIKGDVFKLVSTCIESERKVLESSDSKEFCSEVLNSLDSFNLLTDIELVDRVSFDDKFSYFPIIGTNSILKIKGSDEKESSYSLAFCFFYEWAQKFSTFLDNKEGDKDSISLWEDAFSHTPIAMALTSKKGELILHNSKFLKLDILPNEFGKFENGQNIEIDNQTFHIHKKNVDIGESEHTLFLFYGDNDGKEERPLRAMTSQELGIVSSSIAHELNNPLAGILAAISLLELEDWNEDGLSALNEMKDSAKRCKDLVEVFLGFSRMRTNDIEGQSSSSVKSSLGQAIDLLRFRMMESNTKLDLKISSGNNYFKRPMNKSLISMIFYLILGEALTSFAHLKLIQDTQEQTGLRGELVESPEQITLIFYDHIDIKDQLMGLKLIRHLIDLEGLALEVREGRIILTEWKLIS